MSKSDYFNFEEKICDFPFYNKEYSLSKYGLIAFIIAFFVPTIIMFSDINMNNYFGIFILILGLIAIGIASYGDFTSICKKLKFSDVSLIIEMVILQFVFATVVSLIETFIFGVHINANPIVDQSQNIYSYIQVIFDLFGEELFKLIGIFLFAYVIYKFTNNRKKSIVIAVVLSLSIFGLMHYPVYGNVFHALVAIGYASIFTVYTYLKTKNIFVSYLTHLIFDFTGIGFVLLFKVFSITPHVLSLI